MTAYIIRRLIFGVILVFLATVIAFALLRLSPGQVAAGAFDDPRVSREYLEQQRRILGLDRPPITQYKDWMLGVFRGDFGPSFMYKQPSLVVIKSRIGPTLILNIVTLLFTW